MITKMKKLTFLVYHKEYHAFLNDIRDLGVVHVAEKQQGVFDNTELQDNIRLSARMGAVSDQFAALNSARKVAVDDSKAVSGKRTQILNEVDEIQNEKSKLIQQQQGYLKDISSLEPWGNFKPQNISNLHEAGMNVNFYICPERSYLEEWEELYNAMVISRISSKVYFITITKIGEEIDIDAEHIKVPTHSLAEVKDLLDKTNKAIEANENRLYDMAAQESSSLKLSIQELHGKIEFSKVLLNTEKTTGEKLMLLQGWVPVTKEADVNAYLEKHHAYYEITNPTPDDDVPILLKNKGLFAWFEPICKLYMLPKYGEMDLTPFFAPFFMVFFGLCLGDMGYGLFLLLLVTGYRLFTKNIGPTMKPILSLVQILSFSTIVFGALTGGFFGYSIYELDWPIAQWLKETVALDNNQMFQLSLILGVIQILFGMILKVVNQTIQFGFKYAVATLGWVILFISVIVAVLLPSVMPMGGTVHLIVLGIAALMIFLYNSPDKNIFVNIGLGFWDTYNMATGLLGDILSYVRLFALGLSGGILASVFNSLAAGLKPDNVIAGSIVFVLIFLIGHAINIFMNVLGAIVHPMRLTFVEFFKNAGYEGGGKEYNPFKSSK
ncbi:V-type ATP synthase subunit I [Bacteroides sp. 224]|uniref:V-type ATP synthase subunit I n=1 Tax=Bacteroides sp. 224 TaxID=2302936 RepID=UPI0013D478DC|nr:V-type ATPase 116kDa subunit family protein [Bacteroides sp. 224]NDV66847.1 V-type ATP synthase subunit I [Bacteroides sp. 224]